MRTLAYVANRGDFLRELIALDFRHNGGVAPPQDAVKPLRPPTAQAPAPEPIKVRPQVQPKLPAVKLAELDTPKLVVPREVRRVAPQPVDDVVEVPVTLVDGVVSVTPGDEVVEVVVGPPPVYYETRPYYYGSGPYYRGGWGWRSRW